MIRTILNWLLADNNGPPDVMFGAARSSKWAKVRDDFIRQQGECAVCGTREALEAHHVVPFHVDQSRELDPANLIALCRPHHLLFGHLMNWQTFNPFARADASQWRQKIKDR